MSHQNIARAKAIEQENKKRLLKLNPKLNDKSGIYFLLREDENGFKFAYVGQAVHILQRLASHLVGYEQHIDLSIRKHKLYSEDNPYGWRVEFLNFPESQLDEKEKYYIKLYADKGYQLRNVSLGGQGENRASGSIGERKAPKGYMQGIQQGKKVLARELSSIAEKHLIIRLKPEKEHNKVSQKQYEKFMDLINIGNCEVNNNDD
nr:MAG TPA: GIY-YIG nuclease superfamily protein [Caudoviricetes sp.]